MGQSSGRAEVTWQARWHNVTVVRSHGGTWPDPTSPDLTPHTPPPYPSLSRALPLPPSYLSRAPQAVGCTSGATARYSGDATRHTSRQHGNSARRSRPPLRAGGRYTVLQPGTWAPPPPAAAAAAAPPAATAAVSATCRAARWTGPWSVMTTARRLSWFSTSSCCWLGALSGGGSRPETSGNARQDMRWRGDGAGAGGGAGVDTVDRAAAAAAAVKAGRMWSVRTSCASSSRTPMSWGGGEGGAGGR